jgi:hypothetical protein
METIYPPETSVGNQRTTRRYIPEDSTVHNHRYEDLKSYMVYTFVLSCCNEWVKEVSETDKRLYCERVKKTAVLISQSGPLQLPPKTGLPKTRSHLQVEGSDDGV